MTNFEYIKKNYQTPDAMAKFLKNFSCKNCSCYDEQNDRFTCDEYFKDCVEGIKQWLEQEVTG